LGSDDWGKLFGILAGLWLLGQIFGKSKVDYFRCWKCNNLIPPKTNPCPYCRANVDWGSA